MSITPNEILAKEFRRSLRGYDPGEVDDFLEIVADALARAIKERNLLKERVHGMADELKSLKKEEKEIKQMLLSAQRLIDELKVQAEKEAEIIVEEARAQAEAIIDRARQEEERLKFAIAELKRKKATWNSELKAMLRKYLEILEAEDVLDKGPGNVSGEFEGMEKIAAKVSSPAAKEKDGFMEDNSFDL